MCSALGAGHGVDLVEDHCLDAGERVAGRRRQHQEQGFRGGDQDVRGAGGEGSALRCGGVTGADAHLDLRLGEAEADGFLADAGEGAAEVALHVDGERLEGETYRTRQRFLGSAGGGVEASWSRAARKAARVLPEPVGATTSTSEPSAMACHAPAWAVVGASNAPVNQPRVAGEKPFRARCAGLTMRPSCTRGLTMPLTCGLPPAVERGCPAAPMRCPSVLADLAHSGVRGTA